MYLVAGQRMILRIHDQGAQPQENEVRVPFAQVTGSLKTVLGGEDPDGIELVAHEGEVLPESDPHLCPGCSELRVVSTMPTIE